MAQIEINYWIPRSPQHLFEVEQLLSTLDLDITETTLSNNLSFTINKEKNKIKANFSSYGLFSLTYEINDNEITQEKLQELQEENKNLLFNEIFKKIQSVSYHQIKQGYLPQSFHMIIYLDEPMDVGEEFLDCENVKITFNNKEKYSPDSRIYVLGEKEPSLEKLLNLYSYTVLASRYLSDVVADFGNVYHKLNDVEALTEDEDFEVLKKLITDTDQVKKECSERHGKLIQAHKTLNQTRTLFSRHEENKFKKLKDTINFKESFLRLEYDFDYIIPLWKDVLITNIENLDFMVNARFELQESLETRKEEKEMKLLQAIFLVGVISSILTLGAMPGAKITLNSPDGTLLAQGNLVSFQLQDLLSFGVFAVFVSVIFFFIFNYIYVNFAKRKNKK